jgi:hypothetical protein
MCEYLSMNGNDGARDYCIDWKQKGESGRGRRVIRCLWSLAVTSDRGQRLGWGRFCTVRAFRQRSARKRRFTGVLLSFNQGSGRHFAAFRTWTHSPPVVDANFLPLSTGSDSTIQRMPYPTSDSTFNLPHARPELCTLYTHIGHPELHTWYLNTRPLGCVRPPTLPSFSSWWSSATQSVRGRAHTFLLQAYQ